MHELGIANSILEAVRTEVSRYPGQYATKVCVRIGELSAIDEEALRFSFEVLSRETDLEGLQLEVEFCPRKHRCRECGEVFIVRDYDIRCAQCASLQTECCGGDELAIAYLEVEEYGTSAVGTKSTE